MSALLAELGERGVLSPLDVALATTLGRLAKEEDERVLLGAAMASRAVQRGHVCADLGRIVAAPLLDSDDAPIDDLRLPPLEAWLAAMAASELTHATEREPAPLVLEGSRLYLARYHGYQTRLADDLLARATPHRWGDEQADGDVWLREALAKLFPPGSDADQQLAAVMALEHRFAVISGGPGTGKTTTVSKILALLQGQAMAAGAQPLRILLLAPTGKAAQRLGEAIEETVAKLDVPESVRAAIPRQAATIHRALGYRPHRPTRFRHNRDNPLAVDAVLADEASMIDLALLAKLVEAVPRHARLILLGDKDQLASVEAGAILGDIYGRWREFGYSSRFAARFAAVTGQALPQRQSPLPDSPAIADCMAHLSRSYRFDPDRGIGALASAINRGDADHALRVLRVERDMPYGSVAIAPLDEERPLAGPLGAAVVNGYADYLEAPTPRERLSAFNRFRVLSPHRRGRLGVTALNALIERLLVQRGLLQVDGLHYDGRPILITQNDYQLELFNGDIGIVCLHEGTRQAYFPSSQARPAGVGIGVGPAPVRAVQLGRLPPHETVYAMTVHKSQGSEMDRVALLLPEQVSPVLTRELVYTAVSRARQRVDVFGGETAFREAIGRRIERASGLSDALWGAPRER